MGIRVECNVIPEPLNIETGRLSYNGGKGLGNLHLVLDGLGPGLGGCYFARRNGFSRIYRKTYNGSLKPGEFNDIFISGRLYRFTGT